MESEPMLTPREKTPFYRKKILPRGGSNLQHCIKQDSEPNTLPTSYSGPRWLVHLYWGHLKAGAGYRVYYWFQPHYVEVIYLIMRITSTEEVGEWADLYTALWPQEPYCLMPNCAPSVEVCCFNDVLLSFLRKLKKELALIHLHTF